MEPTFRHLKETQTFWKYHISTHCKSGPLVNLTVQRKHNKGTKTERHFENAVHHFKGAEEKKKKLLTIPSAKHWPVN